MSMVNARSIKNMLKHFYKDHGREPTMEEFRELLSGRSIPREEKTSEEKPNE